MTDDERSRVGRRRATRRDMRRFVLGAQLVFGLLALGFGCTCAVFAVLGLASTAGPYGVAGMFFLATFGALEKYRKAEE